MSGLGDAVDQISAVTSHIPFFKKLSDRKISSDKEKKSRQEADPGSNSQGASEDGKVPTTDIPLVQKPGGEHRSVT